MNSWGYGKPKMAAWLFLARSLYFFVYHSTFGLDVIQLPLSLGYEHVLCCMCFLGELKISPAIRPLTMANLGNVFPVGVHLPQSPLHWANHMNFGGQPCKLGIITDSITLNYQAKSRELIEKLDSSRTSLITWDWVNWWEGLQFYDIFIWNIADF